jgi:hypothetical protein
MKDDQWPYFFCSAACHEDETLAIDKTLDQVLCLTAIGFEQKKSRIRPQHVTTPGDHRKFYLDPRNKNHLNFLFSGTPAYESLVRIKNLSLEEICQTLTDKGLTPFFKNLTCEELKDENPQVYVVRAMIPGLIPITFGYMQEPLALPRIRCLFFQLNLRNQPLSEQKFMAGYQVHMFA